MWVCLCISLGPSRCLNNAATSTKLKDKVDRSPMNTLMSIPQKRYFLANFRVIYIYSLEAKHLILVWIMKVKGPKN